VEIVRLLIGTLLLRPYVFAFLAIYLALAVPAWGWRRSVLYTLLGYALAWMAEYSSVHNGFPFGPYTYISGPTIERELWVAGVPFMDSLSFVFLSFAGLQTARLIRQPLAGGPNGRWDVRWADPDAPIGWRTWALAGLLTMGLDVVIDPVALQGEKWFLGQIYHYPSDAFYFGVPLANFAGWAALAWAITGAFLLLDRWVLRRSIGNWRGYPADAWLGAALFAAVLSFNLSVTWAIGQAGMGLVGCLWALLMLAPVGNKLAQRPRQARPAEG
jgi:uncharacterized membrane protein